MRTLDSSFLTDEKVLTVHYDSIDIDSCFYPRVRNATIHPMVAFFFRLTPKQIVERYCHTHPSVDEEALTGILQHTSKYLMWAGADLFYTTTATGHRRMTVVETNSCPSGNKSMPRLSDADELGGFGEVIRMMFVPRVKKRSRSLKGCLAVLCDKNQLEAYGYAAAMSQAFNEKVHIVPMAIDSAQSEKAYRYRDQVLEIKIHDDTWQPVRAAFRYVTQKPWTRLPSRLKTFLSNPIHGCLAGGRNKLMAAKAYELLNAELAQTGLKLHSPQTIRDVAQAEIPIWVERFGGQAVIKNPYSNAGQGVWTITNQRELDNFMRLEHDYNQFIVQALIGNASWSSEHEGSRYYHVGTVPNKRGEIFAADLRVMVTSGPEGFRPIAFYARRARQPLARELNDSSSSWDMLGTNLSQKQADGGWAAETDRLILMDRLDFNRLGIGPDDLIEAYIQTVLSVVAIDKMARRLATQKGGINKRLLKSMNDDEKLIEELGSEVRL